MLPIPENTSAGLIFGPEYHHLDHLAPLCALLNIPLIVTDEKMATLAQNFYIDLDIIHWAEHEAPEKVIRYYDTIIYSIPRVLFDQVFYFAQAMHNKHIRTIWCPHGNSDKGRKTPYMEALEEEEILLTYGPRIESFLKEKKIKGDLIRVGNYRLAYYQKHKAFYDALLPPKEKPVLLYAPTWQDQENNSSFPKIWPILAKAPKHFQIIVKLHPNLYQQFSNEIKQLDPTILLEDFPPIYPILAQTDLYIGDSSSIGYDFLAFQRPMLLLTPSPLADAATFLPEEEYPNIFEKCEELLSHDTSSHSLYEETFSPYFC